MTDDIFLISQNCITIFLISVSFNTDIIPVSLEMFLVSGSVETLGYGGVIFLLGA
jgi:hypothetical protein